MSDDTQAIVLPSGHVSQAKHGTISARRAHTTAGEEACLACAAARRRYDAERLSTNPQALQKKRLRSQAARIALTALVARYKAEYQALYQGNGRSQMAAYSLLRWVHKAEYDALYADALRERGLR